MLEALEPRVLLSATAVADLFTVGAVEIVEGNVLENDVAGLTAPADLAYEAESEDGTDQTWEEANGAAGFDLTLGAGVEHEADADSSLPGIVSAYRFSGGSEGATMPSLQQWAGDPTGGAASFELWVRPDDLSDTDVLFETGSADTGLALSAEGEGLRFTVHSGGAVAGEVVAEAGAAFGTGGFHQVVGTIDPGGESDGGELALYVDGEPLGSASIADGLTGWADGDATGLGAVAGSAAGPKGASGFEGDIAALRFYETALSEQDVRDHYSARAARVTASDFLTELGGTVNVEADGAFTYDPTFIPGLGDLEPGESRTDRFHYEIDDGFGQTSEAVARVEIRVEPVETEVDLGGAVFEDLDNDGVRDDGEPGIEGATVRLFDAGSGEMLAERQTDADGGYLFDEGLGPGTYELVEVQPDGYLDGEERAGELDGIVDNAHDSNTIGEIMVSEETASGAYGGYGFADLRPAELSGRVWLDMNQDGEERFPDRGVDGVQLHLTGTDDRGDRVSLVAETNSAGQYRFSGLRPGRYAVREIQPEHLRDGADVLGSVDGVLSGYLAANDVFRGIELSGSGSVGAGYTFTERAGRGRPFGDVPPIGRGGPPGHARGGGFDTIGGSGFSFASHGSFGGKSLFDALDRDAGVWAQGFQHPGRGKFAGPFGQGDERAGGFDLLDRLPGWRHG